MSHKLLVRIKGGPGSGNWGHAGRPGMVGGSSGSSDAKPGGAVGGISKRHPEFANAVNEMILMNQTGGKLDENADLGGWEETIQEVEHVFKDMKGKTVGDLVSADDIAKQPYITPRDVEEFEEVYAPESALEHFVGGAAHVQDAIAVHYGDVGAKASELMNEVFDGELSDIIADRYG